MAGHYKLYAKLDKKNADNIQFIGTMKEISEAAGVSENTIRAYISYCAKRNKYCPYICLGDLYSKEEKEQLKKEYFREYGKMWRRKQFEKELREKGLL